MDIAPAPKCPSFAQFAAFFRGRALDELAYARAAKASPSLTKTLAVQGGVRRARMYWRMMLVDRRLARRFDSLGEGPILPLMTGVQVFDTRDIRFLTEWRRGHPFTTVGPSAPSRPASGLLSGPVVFGRPTSSGPKR